MAYIVNIGPIQKMDDPTGPSTITLHTLVAAIIGFLAVVWSPLLVLLYLPLAFLPRVRPIPLHPWLKVASFTGTCLAFGLINGWTLLQLCHYFNSPDPTVPTLSIYLSLTTVYHYFEFQMVNNFHHPSLSWHSFLIYHSKHYTVANVFLFVEHAVTRYLLELPYKKTWHPLMWVGLLGAVAGEGLRVAAFFTCKSNFTHLVSYSKAQKHTLITNGVYSFFRHPAYTGYFYYCVFSQLFLGNFLSMLGFVFTLIHFFTKRIEFEEEALINFFKEYPDYKKRTRIMIPFVRDPQFEHYRRAAQEDSD